MFQAAIEALIALVQPICLLYMMIGILLGSFIGFLPGLGGSTGLALVIPFVFGMEPVRAIALMIGVMSVTNTADTFTSVLFGVPGTTAAQATIMDGFPLAQQGKAGKALGASFIASMIGGVIGAVFLFVSIPVAKPIIMSFGSPELFMLTLFGICIVSAVIGEESKKGILLALLGLILGTVGPAPAAPVYRFTFDTLYLYSGLKTIPLILGMFAIPEMIVFLTSNETIAAGHELSDVKEGVHGAFRHLWLIIKSSILGAFIGFIPGVGGGVVDWAAYYAAKKSYKDEYFGKGDIRGVIAPESANNAKTGGALIPTLLFGIPGNNASAILLGGLLLMGISTGPKMLSENLSTTLTIVWTVALANIIAALLCLSIAKYIAKLTAIDPNKFVPFIFIFIFLGAYQSSMQWMDIILMIGISILGWLFKKLNWPRVPFTIGFILANGSERYFFLSVGRFGAKWLFRPVVVIIGIIIILCLFGDQVKQQYIRIVKKRGKNNA